MVFGVLLLGRSPWFLFEQRSVSPMEMLRAKHGSAEQNWSNSFEESGMEDSHSCG
jgi:hypothetical protein